MSLKQQIKTGQIYCEWGHGSEEDKEYEKILDAQRIRGKDLMFEYNNIKPSDQSAKRAILQQVLGGLGAEIWIEAPAHFSYGCNTYIGEHFYANYNMIVVDDGDVHIGNNVMFAPNVTISTTGHPVHPEYRTDGSQFSLPVNIGDNVWIGANVVILPGVSIGTGTVIGAGSVVTHDIPANVVAFGVPCKVIREIGDKDKEYYYKDRKINHDWRK